VFVVDDVCVRWCLFAFVRYLLILFVCLCYVIVCVVCSRLCVFDFVFAVFHLCCLCLCGLFVFGLCVTTFVSCWLFAFCFSTT
jgi:hypothetical protein